MATKKPDIRAVFTLPFEAQIDFFRRKLNLPTERWDDIQKSAHDRAFVVAGATKADLLDDLRKAVDKSIANSGTLEEFRKDFRAIVEKHGWHDWTGEGSEAGEAWRTKVIWQTNIRTSHAAGRYAQLTNPDTLKALPYWRYVHNELATTPRPQHKHWGEINLTLPADHEFWQTHYPPNGWGCGCRVVGMPAPKEGAATTPPEGWNEINPATGAPKGIDKGWAYAPGANTTTPLLELIQNKLISLDAPIGAQMWEHLRPAVAMEQRLALTDMVDRIDSTMQQTGYSVLVTCVKPEVVAKLEKIGHPMETADIWLRDEELTHGMRDSKRDRLAALPPEVWRDLPNLLDKALPYFDTIDPGLVYALDINGIPGKIIIQVNYRDKIKDSKGKRSKIKSNFIRTGGIVERFNVMKDSRYTPLFDKE